MEVHDIVQEVVTKSESEVTQLCLTLCDPMDYSLPGSSIRGIFQARILEWVAISFSKRSFQPRDQTQVSHTAHSSHFIVWAIRETQNIPKKKKCKKAKWLSKEALQIAEKREAKGKGENERFT